MTLQEKSYCRINDSFNRQAFLTYIGAKLGHVEKGKVTISCKHNETLTQQHGFLHAGVVTALADVSCGYAALSTISSNETEVLSAEFKINSTFASG